MHAFSFDMDGALNCLRCEEIKEALLTRAGSPCRAQRRTVHTAFSRSQGTAVFAAIVAISSIFIKGLRIYRMGGRQMLRYMCTGHSWLRWFLTFGDVTASDFKAVGGRFSLVHSLQPYPFRRQEENY